MRPSLVTRHSGVIGRLSVGSPVVMDADKQPGDRPGIVRVTVVLPFDDTAPAIARRFVHDHRDDLDPTLVAEAQLLVSEIVTNALRYGRPEITLAFSRWRPGMGIAVSDTGAELPVMPTGELPPPGNVHGRGLHIVNALATRWGVDTRTEPEGKTVWFQLTPRS